MFSSLFEGLSGIRECPFAATERTRRTSGHEDDDQEVNSKSMMMMGRLFKERPLIRDLAIIAIVGLAVVAWIRLHLSALMVASEPGCESLYPNVAMSMSSEIPDSLLRPSRSNVVKSGSAVMGPMRSLQDDSLDPQSYLPLIARSGPITYYVSRTGSNADGTSWVTAWDELDQIDWDVIEPGDTIQLDGGLTEMVYTTTLRVEGSGTRDQPVTIEVASESDRDGRAIIFGGRSTPLPYCGQTDYSYETAGVRGIGILIGDSSWVIIDGRRWRGIAIYGHNRNGIRLYPDSDHITVRNVEIYDNGTADHSSGGWAPDGKGVDLAGTSITFERSIIHDNGQDAFQSAGEVGDFTLRQSWLYNSRKNPTKDEPFNYCKHPDGMQIFDGGVQSGFLIEETIIGPGFMQGVILGQARTAADQEAIIHDVTLRDVLFTKAFANNIMGYPNIKSEDWVLDHVTAHCPNTSGQCFFLEGSGHTVRDSIFHSGNIYLPDGLHSYGGNCEWNTTGFQLGQVVDPLFADVNDGDPFSLDDYSLSPDSPCFGKGSSMTSVDQLLAQPDPGRELPGLSWEGEARYVRFPFIAHHGYLSQPIGADHSGLGGLASHRLSSQLPATMCLKPSLTGPSFGLTPCSLASTVN